MSVAAKRVPSPDTLTDVQLRAVSWEVQVAPRSVEIMMVEPPPAAINDPPSAEMSTSPINVSARARVQVDPESTERYRPLPPPMIASVEPSPETAAPDHPSFKVFGGMIFVKVVPPFRE